MDGGWQLILEATNISIPREINCFRPSERSGVESRFAFVFLHNLAKSSQGSEDGSTGKVLAMRIKGLSLDPQHAIKS